MHTSKHVDRGIHVKIKNLYILNLCEHQSDVVNWVKVPLVLAPVGYFSRYHYYTQEADLWHILHGDGQTITAAAAVGVFSSHMQTSLFSLSESRLSCAHIPHTHTQVHTHTTIHTRTVTHTHTGKHNLEIHLP